MAEIKGSREVCNHCHRSMENIERRVFGYTSEKWSFDYIDKSYDYERYEDEFTSTGEIVYFCGHCGKKLDSYLQNELEINIFQ